MKPGPGIPNIHQQLADKEAELIELRARARAAALAEIQERILELNVQPNDFQWPAKPRAKHKPKGPDLRAFVPVKFRDDETGDTWSGRGSMPRWLAGKVAEGRAIVEFTVTRQDANLNEHPDAEPPADGEQIAAESGGVAPGM